MARKAEETVDGVKTRKKSNGPQKEIRLIGANLKALERRYSDVATYSDGVWSVPKDCVTSIENRAVYVAESLTTFMESVRLQAK
jgi:hypothetical protein